MLSSENGSPVIMTSGHDASLLQWKATGPGGGGGGGTAAGAADEPDEPPQPGKPITIPSKINIFVPRDNIANGTH